jgi:hypothetical protein
MTVNSRTLRGEAAMIAIDALDKLSKCRALSDVESWSLERLIRTYEQTPTGAARIEVWRRCGLEMAMHVPELEHLVTETVRGPLRRALAKGEAL